MRIGLMVGATEGPDGTLDGLVAAAKRYEAAGFDNLWMANIERIGLPQVRNYRLNLLSREERSFQEQLDQKAHAYPEMVPLLVIRVEGGGHE